MAYGHCMDAGYRRRPARSMYLCFAVRVGKETGLLSKPKGVFGFNSQ